MINDYELQSNDRVYFSAATTVATVPVRLETLFDHSTFCTFVLTSSCQLSTKKYEKVLQSARSTGYFAHFMASKTARSYRDSHSSPRKKTSSHAVCQKKYEVPVICDILLPPYVSRPNNIGVDSSVAVNSSNRSPSAAPGTASDSDSFSNEFDSRLGTILYGFKSHGRPGHCTSGHGC